MKDPVSASDGFFFCVCVVCVVFVVVVVCFYRGRVSFFVCVVCVCLLLLFVFIGGGFLFSVLSCTCIYSGHLRYTLRQISNWPLYKL